MSNNDATRAGDITKFLITGANTGKSIDFSPIAQEIYYYEDVFQPSIEVKVTIMETGMTDKKSIGPFGVLDTLPIRGGERVNLDINDNQRSPNKLSFKRNKSLYVNKVSDIDPGTQKDIYQLQLSSREFFTNNQTRVVRRYNGSISDNVSSILKEVLLTEKTIDSDSTGNPYNFIGNTRKPFYVCSWLAGRSVPELDNAKAGYFFFETYDGYKFKSLDKLLEGKPVKRYIITGKPDAPPPGYDGKITSVNIGRYIDLERNLNLGMYANSSIYFDYVDMKYQVRDYSISDQKEKIENAGKQDLDWTATEFSRAPSRLLNHVQDIGTLPSGKTPQAQLKEWKNQPNKPTFDAYNAMVQTFMRYNQLFTIKTDVIIAGDFSLRAGDLIYCDFAQLSAEHNKEVNKQTGGIYMIASLCHRITREDCYTSLTLVRDTFGRKPWKD